jgi:preprotein translocase subunit SecA
MLKRFIHIVGGDPNKREIEKLSDIVKQINSLEEKFESYSNEALRAKTDEFRSLIDVILKMRLRSNWSNKI